MSDIELNRKDGLDEGKGCIEHDNTTRGTGGKRDYESTGVGRRVPTNCFDRRVEEQRSVRSGRHSESQ